MAVLMCVAAFLEVERITGYGVIEARGISVIVLCCICIETIMCSLSLLTLFSPWARLCWKEVLGTVWRAGKLLNMVGLLRGHHKFRENFY